MFTCPIEGWCIKSNAYEIQTLPLHLYPVGFVWLAACKLNDETNFGLYLNGIGIICSIIR